VIGRWSSKLRIECRWRRSAAAGESGCGGVAETARRSIGVPGQRGRTAGGDGITPA
jgi:hypothetical protein